MDSKIYDILATLIEKAANDPNQLEIDLKGEPGKPGRGIKNIRINGNNELIVRFDDGEIVNAGKLPKGEKGDSIVGPPGPVGSVIKGDPGVDGLSGKDGNGVREINISADNDLIFTLDDGTRINAGKIPENKSGGARRWGGGGTTKIYVDNAIAAAIAGLASVYVPYAGATGDVDLGSNSLIAESATLNKTTGTLVSLDVTGSTLFKGFSELNLSYNPGDIADFDTGGHNARLAWKFTTGSQHLAVTGLDYFGFDIYDPNIQSYTVAILNSAGTSLGSSAITGFDTNFPSAYYVTVDLATTILLQPNTVYWCVCLISGSTNILRLQSLTLAQFSPYITFNEQRYDTTLSLGIPATFYSNTVAYINNMFEFKVISDDTLLSVNYLGQLVFNQFSGASLIGVDTSEITRQISLGTGLSLASNVLSNTGVTSISGTTNQVTVTPTTGTSVVSLPDLIVVPDTIKITDTFLSNGRSGVNVLGVGWGAVTSSGAGGAFYLFSGWEFTVGSNDILVKNLGVADAAFFSGSRNVGIYTNGGALLVSTSVAKTDTLSGKYRIIALGSLYRLTAGQSYMVGSVVSLGAGDIQVQQCSAQVYGTGITFVNGKDYNNNNFSLTLPSTDIASNNPTSSFLGASFEYEVAVDTFDIDVSDTTQYGTITVGVGASLYMNNQTASSILVLDSANKVSTATGGATTGQILQYNSGSVPSFSTPTYPSASGTAGQILRSNATNNIYSTASFADTYAASSLLYSNGANTVTGLATANNAVLVTSGAGVPSLAAAGTGLQISSSSLAIANTAVSAASYGSGTSFTNFTVNAQGQLTAASSVALSGVAVTSLSGTANQINMSAAVGTVTASLSSTIVAPGTFSIAGNFTLSSYTAGSVLFLGATGIVNQDNTGLFYNDASNFFGVNTATPRVRVDSLSTAAAQFRATYTDNLVYTDFITDSSGFLTITPTGNQINFSATNPIFDMGNSSTSFCYHQYHASSTGIYYFNFYQGAGTGTLRHSMNINSNINLFTLNVNTKDMLLISTTTGYLYQSTASTSGTPQSSPQLGVQGRAWSSSGGDGVTTGVMQMINITNNANPTVDRLAFFVGASGTAATERFCATTGGKFGILDTNPGANLSVVGNAQIGFTSGTTGTSNGLIVSGPSIIGASSYTGAYFVVQGSQSAQHSGGAGGQVYGALFNTILAVATIANSTTLNITPSYNATGGTITNSLGLKVDAGSNSGGIVTNAYGAQILAPTFGGTSNIALYADNASVGYFGITPPSGGMIISGKVAIGASSIGTNPNVIITSATAYGLQMNGTQTADDGSENIVFYISSALSPTTTGKSGYAIYTQANFVAGSAKTMPSATSIYISNQLGSNVGTISSSFGIFIDSGQAAGVGSVVSAAYGLLVNSQLCGTTNNNFGLYVSGKDTAGSTKGTRYLTSINGTITGDDGGTSLGLYCNPTIQPTNNNMYGIGIYNAPTVTPYSTNTVRAIGAYFNLAVTAASGTISANPTTFQINSPSGNSGLLNAIGLTVTGNDSDGNAYGSAYGIDMNGLFVGDDGFNQYLLYISCTMQPNRNNKSTYGIISQPYAIPHSTNTINNHYAIYGYATGSAGSGSIPGAYSGFFQNPAIGSSIKVALYADNLSVGYAITPPSSGAIISGILGIGTSAPAATFKTHLNGSSSVTTNASTGALLIDTVIVPNFSGTLNGDIVSSIYLYPSFSPASGCTASDVAGLYINAGVQGGSGAITRGYGLYVKKAAFGTTKAAIYSDDMTLGGDLTANSSNLIINTAGKTLKIKQGSNACMGTGATMVIGVVTVSTTAVATGDMVITSKTASGGTLGSGDPVVTIVNGTSFTLTSSSALETSTFSWWIVKAA